MSQGESAVCSFSVSVGFSVTHQWSSLGALAAWGAALAVCKQFLAKILFFLSLEERKEQK